MLIISLGYLLALREATAAFADLGTEQLRHALVTEIRPGAAIGWHSDKAVFGEAVGVSHLATCVSRLRRKLSMRKWE